MVDEATWKADTPRIWRKENPGKNLGEPLNLRSKQRRDPAIRERKDNWKSGKVKTRAIET